MSPNQTPLTTILSIKVMEARRPRVPVMASSEMANENSQRGLCVHQRHKQAPEKDFHGNANSSTDKREPKP